MRLFRANQPHLSEEDRAATMRLTNIASRYRPEPSAEPGAEVQPSADDDQQTSETGQ